MVLYKLFVRDKEGNEHFIGILPEKRRDRKRITEESLINLSRTVLGDEADIDLWRIRFVQVGFIEPEHSP